MGYKNILEVIKIANFRKDKMAISIFILHVSNFKKSNFCQEEKQTWIVQLMEIYIFFFDSAIL